MKQKNNQQQNNSSVPSNHKKLEFPNLIPLMVYEYRKSALNTLKNWFVDSLLECIKVEREFCKQNKLEPMMTQEKANKIQDILDQCQDVYEIQALSDYVFIENIIPDDYQQVKSRGLRLKLLYPIFNNERRK